METGIAGRAAIVAAASKGLGKAVAIALAREGVRVCLFSRSQENIERAADEVRTEGAPEVLALAADVAVATDIQRVVGQTVERFGTVDILFNNAGGPPPGLFDSLDDAAWQQAYELNLMSAIRLSRAVLPYMKKQRWGRIINSTSISVMQPLGGLLLSNSLRSALVSAAKTLSDEVAAFGITVNNLAPGRIETDRLVELDAAAAKRQGRPVEAIRQAELEAIPMGRYGRPDEYAAAAVFLASEAASYITGVTLLVDGGKFRGTY